MIGELNMSPECYRSLKISDEVKVEIGIFNIRGFISSINRNEYNVNILADDGRLYQDFSYQLVTYLGPARPIRSTLIEALKELIEEYEE